MALVLKDRVREASYSTGTGAITMAGAYTGYQSFSNCIPDGSVVYYCITNGQAGHEGEWEVGYGTYTLSTDELSRDSVYASSNANALVNFSNPSTLTVFITQPAEQAIYQEVNGDLRLVGGVIGLSEDGTQGTTLPNTSFQAFTTGDYYMQANQQNLDSGANASSDWVSTADNGSDTDNFIDMGMASSGYNYPDFGAQDANSGYIISTGANLQLVAGKYGANVAGANASATDIMFVAGDLLKSGVRGTIHGSTGNFVLGPYGTTDTGEKLQVTGAAKVTGNATFGATVTLSANPNTALEAATKQYVDNATSTGIHIHDPCASETSAALSAVYTQGGTTFNITDITGTNTVVTSTTHGLSINDEIWLTTTAGNGLSINTAYFVYATPTTTSLQLSTSYAGPLLTGLTNASGLSYATRANSGVGAYLEASANQALPIAGVSVSDRVLVYNQATGYWNGVYTVTALGAADPGGSKWKLTRATDANKYQPDNTTGLGAGDYFFIQSNSEAYVLTDPTGPVIIGYDAITYTLFSSVPIYTGTSPINVSGSTISLDTVPVASGGTGLTSYATGDVIYASGTNVLSARSIGSSGNTFIVSGGVPTWGTLDLSSANAVSNTLTADHGGTGINTYTVGDLIYSSATNTLSKLAGQTTTTKKYLSQTGDGVNSAAPAWSQVAAADISGLAPSATTDTSNATNITSGTLPSGRLTGSYTGVTGVGTLTDGTWTANTIGASYGGTGVAGTITGIPYANGASAYTAATGSQVVTLIGSNAVANATYAVSSNSSTYTSNIIGGAAGSIPYQTGSNTTALLATGSGVLVGGTTPAWSTTPTLTGTNFSGIPNSATTAASANGASTIVARDINGSFAGNVVTATNFAGSGAQLTNLNASNVSSGTIPSAILGNSTVYIGTTAIALNRTTASQTLTGVSIDGSAGSASTATNVAAANLTGSTLSSNVTSSSLTAVGTIATGTWSATTIAANKGGTGVAGTITGLAYANGASAYSAATAAQVVSVIGSTAVANATYATSAGSASTATLATKASTLAQGGGSGTGMTFNWSGQSGQPSWLWGSNDGTNIYVWNPSNFSVNYATSAGSATSATSASYSTYLTTNYVGGQQLNPQTYFSNTVGVKVAMTAAAGVWSDTLWINGYSGGDVLSMCALHTQRNGTPRMYISTQNSTATSYGTLYEFLTAYNYTSYSPSLTGSGASGTWGISISGTASYANNIESTQPSIGYSISGQNIDYGGQGGPQVRSQGGGAAMMSFHRPGAYAINFGLGTDNQLRTGGWSRGGNYVILDSGNYSSYALPLSGGTMSGTIYSGSGYGSIIIGQYGGATRGYLYNDTSGFGMLRWDGNWAFQIPYGGGYCIANESMRSPIFYDYNNTAYYADPNATSQFSRVNADNFFYGNGNWSYFTGIYDTNDTGYYVDPNGTSNFNAINKNGYGMYACRAWVNFNGTFASNPFTIANGGIRGAENVSSVTDNGTGDYTVNFSTAMADANYSASVAFGNATTQRYITAIAYNAAPTASAIRCAAASGSNALIDPVYCYVAVFR